MQGKDNQCRLAINGLDIAPIVLCSIHITIWYLLLSEHVLVLRWYAAAGANNGCPYTVTRIQPSSRCKPPIGFPVLPCFVWMEAFFSGRNLGCVWRTPDVSLTWRAIWTQGNERRTYSATAQDDDRMPRQAGLQMLRPVVVRLTASLDHMGRTRCGSISAVGKGIGKLGWDLGTPYQRKGTWARSVSLDETVRRRLPWGASCRAVVIHPLAALCVLCT